MAFLASLLVLGVAGAQEPQASPQPGRVKLEAHLGFTPSPGLSGGWAPVEVSLHNTGAARTLDLVVLLQLGGDDGALTFRRRLRLAAGSKRREWFVVPVNPSYLVLTVSLREQPVEGDDELGELVIQTEPEQFYFVDTDRRDEAEARILYVTNVEKEARRRARWIVGYSQEDLLGVRSPERLPDRALAYDGLDLVALHDSDLSGLSLVQRAALRDWVMGGGTLLLVPGRRLAWFNDPVIRGFLGEAVVSAHEVTRLPQLESNYLTGLDPDRRQEPFLVYTCQTQRGTSSLPDAYAERMRERLPESGQTFDLLQEKRFGRGHVFVLAADLSAPPFDRWQGRDTLVTDMRRRMLQRAHSVMSTSRRSSRGAGPRAVRVGYSWQNSPFNRPNLTRALSSTQRPSSLFVVGLALVYVMCVGPLNYRLLRRRDRQMLLVVTVPAISLAFCVVVVLAGYANQGLGTLVWRATVVSTDLGAPSGFEQTGVSIRTSHATELEVELDPALVGTRVFSNAGAASSARHQEVVLEDSVRYPRVPLQIWEQATFEGFALRDLGGGLHLDGAGGRARVRNDTPWPLKRVVLVKGRAVYVLGAVGRGEQVSAPDEHLDLRPRDWDRLIAEGLFEGRDEREFCARLLREYTPYVGSWRSKTFVVALVDARLSKILVDGSERADRELTLLVAREQRTR